MNNNRKTMAALGAAAAAALAYSYLPSQIGKVNRKLKRSAKGKTENLTSKVIYLTFDDGPHPEYTEKLLNLLGEYDVKATFFVVGKFASENPELILRMAEEGHSIGLHSYGHKSAMVQWAGSVRKDMEKSLQVLEDLGAEPMYYRPPWGHVNWFTLREIGRLGLKKVLWDVMAEDWEKDTDDAEIQYKLLKRVKSGDIICLHDRQADEENGGIESKQPLQMISALEKTIPLWLEEGYRFEVVR